MWAFLRFIWAELSQSDARRTPPEWYRKGNVLLAHAMLGVILTTLLGVWALVPIWCLYAIKEIADGEIVDGVMDTAGVVLGTLIVVGPAEVSILILLILWTSYPWRAYHAG